MHVQQAHELFSRRRDRSMFEVHTSLRGEQAWPLSAAAAVSLSGQLDDCLTGEDLDLALGDFLQLYRHGIVGRDDLEAEIGRVMLSLADAEYELTASAGER